MIMIMTISPILICLDPYVIWSVADDISRVQIFPDLAKALHWVMCLRFRLPP